MAAMLPTAVLASLAAGAIAFAAPAAAAPASADAAHLAQLLDERAEEAVQQKRQAVAKELRKMSETMSDLASKPIGNGGDPMMARRLEAEQSNLSVIASKLRAEADKLAYPSTSGAQGRNELEIALRKVESLQESVRERRQMADEAIQKSGGKDGPLAKLLTAAVDALSDERVKALRGNL